MKWLMFLLISTCGICNLSYCNDYNEDYWNGKGAKGKELISYTKLHFFENGKTLQSNLAYNVHKNYNVNVFTNVSYERINRIIGEKIYKFYGFEFGLDIKPIERVKAVTRFSILTQRDYRIYNSLYVYLPRGYVNLSFIKNSRDNSSLSNWYDKKGFISGEMVVSYMISPFVHISSFNAIRANGSDEKNRYITEQHIGYNILGNSFYEYKGVFSRFLYDREFVYKRYVIVTLLNNFEWFEKKNYGFQSAKCELSLPFSKRFGLWGGAQVSKNLFKNSTSNPLLIQGNGGMYIYIRQAIGMFLGYQYNVARDDGTKTTHHKGDFSICINL